VRLLLPLSCLWLALIGIGLAWREHVAAQDVRFIVLDAPDAQGVALAATQKREADRHWRAVERYIRDKYTGDPTGDARSGETKVEAKSTRKGWEYGFDFSHNCLESSRDCNLIVARPKPGCVADENTDPR
jgi:hypothetical protein